MKQNCIQTYLIAAFVWCAFSFAAANAAATTIVLNGVQPTAVQSLIVDGHDYFHSQQRNQSVGQFAVYGALNDWQNPVRGAIIQVTALPAQSRVVFNIHATNTGSTVWPGLHVKLGALCLGKDPSGWTPSQSYTASANDSVPVIKVAAPGLHDVYVVAETATELTYVRVGSKQSDYWPASAEIQRPVQPGETVKLQVSFRFQKPGSDSYAAVSDVAQAWVLQHPYVVNWPDRRPIGYHVFARANLHQPKNPNGYLPDWHVDITTPAGLTEFYADVMYRANQCVALLTDVGAQALITWDIEGQAGPQGSYVYVGDPRLLPKIAPEMHSVADAYFKRIADAGFLNGICLRDDQAIIGKNGTLAHYPYPSATFRFNDLYAKVLYCKKRWNTRVFYIDSWTGDPQTLAQLQLTFRDCLFCPEDLYSSDALYAASMPYMQPNIQGYRTPAFDMQLYPGLNGKPGAGSLVNLEDGMDASNQAEILKAITNRSIIPLYEAWGGWGAHHLLKQLHQQKWW